MFDEICLWMQTDLTTHLNACSYVCLQLFFNRILTRLLEVSDDPQVIAVAAHDIGEYVRHYPRGKR